MKKLIIACVYSSSLLYMPTVMAAETAAVKGVSENNATTSSTGASVKDSADQSASKNSSGQLMSLLSAGMLAVQSYNYYTTCTTCPGTCTSACVMAGITAGMAALSMMQSKEHGSAAAASNLTSGLSDGQKDPYATGSYDPTTSTNPDVRAATNAFDKLKNTGTINQTKGTITTPDGKTYKISDFASEKAMTAAGIPSGAAKGAMNNIDKITAKAAEKAEKIVGKSDASSSDDSFGGGGGSTTIVAVDDEAGGGLGQGRGAGLGSKRDPAQLAGMQKNYNGEPIGVAADSIFLMMNRRYQVKQSQDSFFGEMDLRLQK